MPAHATAVTCPLEPGPLSHRCGLFTGAAGVSQPNPVGNPSHRFPDFHHPCARSLPSLHGASSHELLLVRDLHCRTLLDKYGLGPTGLCPIRLFFGGSHDICVVSTYTMAFLFEMSLDIRTRYCGKTQRGALPKLFGSSHRGHLTSTVA